MNSGAKPSKQDLYTSLKVRVLTMQLAPGADLDEAALSEEFGVSRTPLREVYRQLASEGYLELRTNRTARVSAMTHLALRDFFLAAPMIYGAILRLAAQNATADQIRDLKRAQSDFKATLSTGSVADRALANNRFHAITGDMAGNIYLLPSFHRLLIDHARIGMTFYQPGNTETAAKLTTASDQHDHIIAAIEARDATAAAQLAEDHWALSRNQIEMFAMPQSLTVPLGTLTGHAPERGADDPTLSV